MSDFRNLLGTATGIVTGIFFGTAAFAASASAQPVFGQHIQNSAAGFLATAGNSTDPFTQLVNNAIGLNRELTTSAPASPTDKAPVLTIAKAEPSTPAKTYMTVKAHSKYTL